MATVHHSMATLRILGDELEPAQITQLLGCEPSEGRTKGQETVSQTTGKVRIARTGRWSLHAGDREPADLDAQIAELLAKVTSDFSVWESIAARYSIDLFCGVFLEGMNEGLSIAAESLEALGRRRIELGLDIYSGNDESDEPARGG